MNATQRNEIAGLLMQAAALLTAEEPAKPAVAKTRKAQPKAETKATKGSQTRETLSRKGWNRTLTAKAKLAGKFDDGTSVYAWVLEHWTTVQGYRDAGMTPDQALAEFI